MPHRLHLEQFGPVHALPILHYRMEFAHLVRQAIDRVKPDCIAIELPDTIGEQFIRGVRRLPEISVIWYDLKGNGGSQTVYLLIEPADPLVEGARLALERQIPLQLIDLDVEQYPEHHDLLPDSYAVQRIGLAPYYLQYCCAAAATTPSTIDRRRESGMAWRLQQLAKNHERILLLCGMSHLERLRTEFAQPQTQPLTRSRRSGVNIANLHPDSCREILGEFPFISSIYELRRNKLPPEPVAEEGSLRKRYKMLELINGGKTEVSEESILRRALERTALHVGAEGEMPDRQRIQLRLFQETAKHYKQETGEPVHIWQKRTFFRFARNYAAISGRLLPDLFQMLASARGCVDDNFAFAFCRLATFYPWQREDSELPNIRLSPEDVWGGSRLIRFRPRQQRLGKGLSPLQFLKRKREKHPGDWLKGFDNASICSFPPEDLAIEDYGRFLKKKGAKQLSEEQWRVEPLTSSLLDGIDMRETLRNIHEGKIYVKEQQRVKGGVGSVVVIFDHDRDGTRFPYMMTWLGEHDQESDMAFYATPPADNVAGPGICRCEYGGFMLSYPPMRMHDVWRDPDYAFARGKHELLLLAALDYTIDPHVVYVAPRPPRSIFRQIAARMGKKIVFMPLGSLSPVKLKAIRVLHILYGHDKREIAKEYIW
jgi:hypothetical protein